MNGDWKEFHLVAEPVVREIAPGMKAHLWGYNGQSPGPTIEAVEGDKVRIFVTNRLPENTAIHWHGILLPSGMDGVGGLTQPHIEPGKTFVYEFVMQKSGTFMCHPHSDEMVQMAMGMMGFFVVHPRDPKFMRVDRDFLFLLNAFDIDPGSYVPKGHDHARFQPVDLEQPGLPTGVEMKVRKPSSHKGHHCRAGHDERGGRENDVPPGPTGGQARRTGAVHPDQHGRARS
jgi:FtsP/CotA-like multicopper oxidase with cupredoxin domain